MSKYSGLYTFDTDNHKYVTLSQTDGFIDLLDTDDYVPTEPLIKDPKIRKAVRAWAEAEKENCYYGKDAKTIYNGSGDKIEFWDEPFRNLEKDKHYTITELCGEQ